jgi:hypothetical protein
VDTGPLALLWVGGFVHLATEAQLKFDKSEITTGVGTLLSAFGAWYVSGKIAGLIAAALAATAFTGVGLILAALGALSMNAIINALFTYRFLAASASVMEDRDANSVIFFKWMANYITEQLLSYAEIPRDLVKTARLMFGF